MPSMPGFVRGRDLLFIYVFPIEVGSDDLFDIPTLTSDFSLSNYVDFVRTTFSPTLDMIQSIDITDENYETVMNSFTASLGGIMRKAGVNGTNDPILGAVLTSDCIGVQYGIRSNGADPTVVTLICTRADFNFGVQSAGKNPDDLTLRPKTWANMPNNPLTVGNVTGIVRPVWITGAVE